MDRFQWLLFFRRYKKIDNLELIFHRKINKIPKKETMDFLSAADHRRAELIMKCLYDRVPKNIWHFVK